VKKATIEPTTEELVRKFIDFSIEQADALEINDVRTYRRLYQRLDEIEMTLRRRGLEARRALVPLLDYTHQKSPYYMHQPAQVRLNAAKELLAVAPEKALATLENLATQGPSPQRGAAGMCLEFLKDGTFKPT
jgi:hypothetical protein